MLSDTQVEHYFGGYHYLNCMMALLKRKDELVGLINSYQNADGQDIIKQLRNELSDIMLVDKSKMLGREYTLGKNTNPLLDVNTPGGNLSLSTVQT